MNLLHPMPSDIEESLKSLEEKIKKLRSSIGLHDIYLKKKHEKAPKQEVEKNQTQTPSSLQP